MEKYFKRKSTFAESSSQVSPIGASVRPHIHINLEELEVDPPKRKSIYEYHVNDRDVVRRWYLQKGPCQPQYYTYPTKVI